MADPFEDVLDLEENFYQEGYDAGISDGHQAGLIEGKVFGIEKGFEKALEMGRLQGRAMVWEKRLIDKGTATTSNDQLQSRHLIPEDALNFEIISSQISPLPKNSRFQKHVEALLTITDSAAISTENSDEAVAEFDEKMTRATARAKVISNITGEPLENSSVVQAGIEESNGLSARH